MLPTLLPCYGVEYLRWQLLDQPFFFYIFSSFRPSLPRFPHGVYKSCAVSCASSPLFRPPRSYPRSCSRYPRPRSHLRYCPRFRPRSRLRSHPMFVYESTPSSPSPCPLPSSFPSCAPSFTFTPVPAPLRARPHDRSSPRPHSRPRLQSHPRLRSLLPVPRIRLPPRYDACVCVYACV